MAYREFEFVQDGGSFVPLLQQMLHFIEQCLTLPEQNKQPLLFKSQTILTELLTNAIKHSGSNYTSISIEAEETTINLIKIDSGDPPQFLNCTALKYPGAAIILSKDPFHILQAIATEEGAIRFIHTDVQPAEQTDINSLSEHFGLLMIAKSAQHFQYHHRAEEGLNIFSARITG